MQERLKLFIVDTDNNFIDQIEEIFITKQSLGIDVIGKATTKNKFFYNKKDISKTDIFVIPASLPDGTGLELVDYIQNNPTIKDKPIIFTIDTQTRNYASIATEKNVGKVFQKPFQLKDFIVAIRELTQNTTVENYDDNVDETFQTNDTFKNNDPSSLEDKIVEDDKKLFEAIEKSFYLNVSDDFDAETRSKKDTSGGLFTFLSPGSTGKSSILVNVAYALRTLPKNKPSVCIVDLNLLFPSISYLFKQDELRVASRDIYDLTADMAYLTDDLMKKALIKHGPTGIHILNTPPDVESIHNIPSVKSEHIEKILSHLKEMFDVVLIDTGNQVTDATSLIPVQNSNETFLVLEPNYISVVGANKIFYVLKKLEETLKEDIVNSTNLVLNKESRNKNLDDDTVKRFLENKEFSIRIPEDPEFLTHLNRGAFLVGSDSITSQPIIELAKLIYPFDDQNTGKKGIILPFLNRNKK